MTGTTNHEDRIHALTMGIAQVLRENPGSVGSSMASAILNVTGDVTEAEWLAEAEKRLAAVQG